jgi:uncharacterized membrane protein
VSYAASPRVGEAFPLGDPLVFSPPLMSVAASFVRVCAGSVPKAARPGIVRRRGQYPPVGAVGTGRLEAFSDGVFAIAATLLILEIHVPSGGRDLGDELLHLWPSYLAYVTSFLSIGVMWLNHHAIFARLARVDHTLLFLNSLLLLVIAFIPFPTELIAEHLRDGGNAERTAALCYGLTGVVLAIAFRLLWTYAARDRRLIRADVPQEAVDDITRTFNPGIPLYAAGAAVAFASPLASVALFLSYAVFYGLPPSLYRRGA